MIYKYISQLSNMQRRLIDRLAKDKDYSGTEGKLIHYLFENRDKTVYQKNIESVFGLRASTATQIIASLEKSGLVKRVPSSTDGRYKEIVLTKKAELCYLSNGNNKALGSQRHKPRSHIQEHA